VNNKAPNYKEKNLPDHLGIWLWIENNQEETYMLFHKKFNNWTIPLEKSSPKETLEEAILRTGREELGIEISNYKILHKQENQYSNTKVLGHLIKVLKYKGTIQNLESQKHTDTGWKSKEFIKQLPEKLDVIKVLKRYT
jgi:ADP-ribose pyrophosphatase YjhB (NUDIX family)